MSSSTGEKARAVFLAALMVLSVVAMSAAFAGSAAAQQAGNEITVDNLSDLRTNVSGQGTAAPGDTILVEEGSYDISTGSTSADIDVTLDNLTVRPADGANPEITISASAPSQMLNITADDVRVEGLTLTDNNGDTSTRAILAEGNGVEIVDNDINMDDGGNAVVSIGGDSPTIEDNTISGGPIAASGSGDAIIRNNSISSSNPGNGNAVFLYSTGDVVIEENNITDWNSDAGSSADVLLVNEVNSLNGNDDMRAGALAVQSDNTHVNSTHLMADELTTVKPDGTISHAVDRASQDYTVLVESGTYNESVTIDTANVTLESTASADETTIDLTDTEDPGKAIAATAVKITAPGVTVDGFNIVGGTYAGTGVSVQVNKAPSGVAITNNTISGFAGEAGGDKKESFGILAWGTDTALENITIRGNTIEDIGSGTNGADTNSQGFGIFLEELADKTAGHKGATIQNNTIRNINGTTISGNDYPGVGVSLLPELTNPDASTGDTGIVTDTPNADLHNNTITSNAVGVSIAGNASQTTVTSNDLSGNGIGVLTEGNVPDDGSVGITEIDAESTESVVSGTVDATSNWWGSTDGPSGDYSGHGASVSSGVSVDPATVDAGSADLDAEFIGVVEDDASALTVSADESAGFTVETLDVPANGTLVLEIAGQEYVFADALDNGAVVETDSNKNASTAIADSTETGTTNISVAGSGSTAIEQAGTVNLVHEAYTAPEEGYFLTSMPQSGDLVYQGINDITHWDGVNDEYESFDDSNEVQSVHKALYMNATSADARYGFSYDTDQSDIRATVGSAELDEGWHVLGSNFNISNTNSIDLQDDLNTQYDPSSSELVVYDEDVTSTLSDKDSVSEYQAYYVYVHQDDSRPIVLPEYNATARGS
ncbi:right-handed parallel beta-helix repeat-containing protein [Halobellus marinus]|uniref:right-handed parallel beta-helix repeat-containing protein n=1 Tax=Halobellus TaxID=1073986 RepID=UPI0028AC0E13|nr:right-handed parallel beta-helix repeat-containing protein [Halobellus sp. DFY28]